jgi:hypothetical protein
MTALHHYAFIAAIDFRLHIDIVIEPRHFRHAYRDIFTPLSFSRLFSSFSLIDCFRRAFI